jgi:hypothetical protein
MIEPYVTDRQCSKCHECKPETEFPYRSDRPTHRRSVCKKCTTVWNALYGRKRRAGETGRAKVVVTTPLPAMDLYQQLACLRLRKWRGPVTKNLVGWRI